MPTVRHTSYFDDDDDEDAYTHSAIKTRVDATSLGPALILTDGTAVGQNKKELNKKYRKIKKDLAAEYAVTYKILSHEDGWDTHDILMKVIQIKNQLKSEQGVIRKRFNMENADEIAANKARTKNTPHVRGAGHESIHVRRIRVMHKEHSTINGLPELQHEIQTIVRKHSLGDNDLPLNPVPKNHGVNKYFTNIALDWCFRAIRVIMQSTLQHILTKGKEERLSHPRMEEYYQASTKAEVILRHMREIRALVRKGRKPRRKATLDPPLADADESASSRAASRATSHTSNMDGDD
jgi:hypothetical protein